ncbi:MAG TPA: phosphodiesterase, partial [Campylobacterales bacterium]|nr:phosphodiesterase [Campylobacterales bacterium]
QKVGIQIFIAISLTLITLHFLPFVDLYLENRDIIMAIFAYSTIALFMTLSENQQSKNIKSIQEAADEIALQQKMFYDQTRKNQLTGLENQIVLKEDIENSNKHISCMVLEIDHFDVIANEFGDKFADELLIQVSQVLQTLTTPNISLYHIYSGRFSFLIDQPTPNQDIHLAKTIKSLFESLQIEYEEIAVSIHFAIAIVREKSKTLTHANMTLRALKKSSKSDYKIYQHDKQKEEGQKNNIYWAKRLSELMNEDKIIVYYQPIIDNFSGDIVKYECLVRAVDGDKIVSPYFFLPAAKSKGILKNITKIVIDKSFQIFQHNDYDFSINITEQDLSENYLVDFLLFKTKQYNIDPKRVFLEVLENINAEDSYDANDQFKKLRALGFGLAIDDFGAEASNLSRLLTLKADLLKIDGQFIKNLDSDLNSVKIVETIVLLAQKMNVKTVAEFVHNEEIYNIVKELGVDFSQGYYFSPPLPQVEEQHEVLLSA